MLLNSFATHRSLIIWAISLELVYGWPTLNERQVFGNDSSNNVTGTWPVTTSLEWEPCVRDNNQTYDCANITVPLDYTNSTSNETFQFLIIRQNGTASPSLGSVLVNPGGPGESGIGLVESMGDEMIEILGGHFDLIGWDPRGVGETKFSCYENSTERSDATENVPTAIDISDTALGSVWAGAQVLSAACLRNAQEDAELVSTAFVARDMVQIIDVLGEDGKLRYWGTSYGTYLGAVFVAMFPDKVDKVLLDAVVNPHDYQAGFMKEATLNADATLHGFYSGCVASPSNCSLAKNHTTEELASEMDRFLEELKYSPMADVDQGTYVTFERVRNNLYGVLKTPEAWPDVADAIDQLMEGNMTAYSQLASSRAEQADQEGEVTEVIKYVDSARPPNNITELTPLLEQQLAQSYIGGGILATDLLGSAAWSIKAKERYEGDFIVNSSAPVLIIGETFDPITPLVSARNLSAGFAKSVVLEQHSYGHGFSAQISLCTVKVVRAYFTNGTLPRNGTVCQPDSPLFGRISASDILNQTSLTLEDVTDI